ncbi:muramidase (phage lysozyme) [Mycoplana sp. BE70]|uniref:hypothetical protein n=1 Tax=Mycoplana sp. BE70 TaxID=2817775 RepID=UPI002864B721|nr:hypothetical protein [Mycoplana sp. BE70]MDR6757850.1 muramidase (phage lysozyme) [Mycoplana sp. BE70]
MDKTVPPGAALLLAFIYQTETSRKAPECYNVIYGHNQDKLPKPLTSMTYDEIVDLQLSWTKRFGSSAAGAAQFMRATLVDLAKANPSLRGDQPFDPDLQDRLAYKLLVRRGFDLFIEGKMSRTAFGQRLAQEWASLPVLAATKSTHRNLKRGQSFYAGDGLNKALVKPERVESVLDRVLAVGRGGAVLDPHEGRVPKPAKWRKPVAQSGRFWTWLLTAGGTIITALKELNVVSLDWRVQMAILAVIVGFAIYAITSMPAVRSALGLK